MTEPIDDEPITEVVSEVGPWAMVPVWVLSKGLTPAELAVYISLRSFADRQGKAHPKARTIAERALVAIGTARNAIQSLRDKKLLSTEEVRRADGSLAGLTYRLRDIDPTPGYAPEERKPRGVRGKGSRSKGDLEATPTPSGADPSTETDTPTPLGVDPPAPSGVQGSTPSGAGVDTKWCTQEHTTTTPQVGTPSEPSSKVRLDDDEASTAQMTIAGDSEPLGPKPPSIHDRTMGIGRWWIAEWEDRAKMPMLGENLLIKIGKAIKSSLNAGCSDEQVKDALVYVSRGVPTPTLLEAALIQVKRGWKAPDDWVPGDLSVRQRGAPNDGRRTNGYGRPAAVADVNEAWADKRPMVDSAAGRSGDWG